MRLVEIYAGTDPMLNRMEYLMARLYERLLDVLGDIGLEGINREEIFRELEGRYTIFLSQSDIRTIMANIMATYKRGRRDARRIIMNGPMVDSTVINDAVVSGITRQVVDQLRWIGDDTMRRLSDSLVIGYRQGEGMDQLRDRIRAEMGRTKASATRLARTTTNEVYNEAHLNTYKDMDIMAGQVVAAKSEGTCYYCKAFDRTIYALDDPSAKWPPYHFNCRCRVVPWLKGVPGPRKIDRDALASYEEFRAKYWPIKR